MNNWKQLDEKEYEEVWDKFYEKFKFEPSMEDFPSFQVHSPYITFDISNVFLGEKYWEDEDDDLILLALKKCSKENETIFALDWQHDCYKGNLLSQIESINELPISHFPDGDYYFFVNEDFSWGYLTHPWEQSITVFGEMAKRVRENQPQIFNNILREA